MSAPALLEALAAAARSLEEGDAAGASAALALAEAAAHELDAAGTRLEPGDLERAASLHAACAGAAARARARVESDLRRAASSARAIDAYRR
ncbi:MAG TPA: hypothetical protein VH880_08110 [Anaeromyxobacteraceae bacterium]